MDTVNAIRGCFVPAGVSSVYDQNLGKNLKNLGRPPLQRLTEAHHRYFAQRVQMALVRMQKPKEVRALDKASTCP